MNDLCKDLFGGCGYLYEQLHHMEEEHTFICG